MEGEHDMSMELTAEKLAKMIDHTYLKAFGVREDFEKLCAEAKENNFATAMVNSCQVSLCRELLKGSDVKTASVVAFPLGQMTVEMKLCEAEKAIEDGASEIDYVLNIGELKMGNRDYIKDEMERMVSLCHGKGALVKVIIETCYLTKDEIKAASEIAREVCPDFIKTSTGFGTGGAVIEDVKLMKDTVGDKVKVKASGGIRNWESCKAMIEAGAERIGTSNGADILKGFKESMEK
ncbi:MAG: deoxyribose-phosphate aldolase [Lachnospiraceae bacterium]|nr:deoxyribose-phosphate aldolase [Lachnospiraceae bacterium]